MKQILFILLCCTGLTVYAKNKEKTEQPKAEWEKVILTKNPEEVKGLIKVDQIKAESMGPFYKASVLRTKTGNKMKQEAWEKGGTIVLIHLDEFSGTPLNSVSMEGTVYKESFE